MRADRLVAIVLLLQTHGQRTASQLAEALETSERTIRRDLDALLAAGIPLYAQRGRGGGWALLGRHRIDLSGLTASEARSLVLAAAGAPGQEAVDAAVRKVLAALPPAIRYQVLVARARVHVDRTGWRQPLGTRGLREEDLIVERILSRLHQALDVGVQVDLRYVRPGHESSWRRVHPHGLVVKAGTWYLVASASSGLRTYKVSRVEAADLTDEPISEPAGFDLANTWGTMQSDFAALRPVAQVTVELLVEPHVWPRLTGQLGAWWDLVDLGVETYGRRRALVAMANAEHAARELVGYADSVEVLGPPEVRDELVALGQRLVARYSAQGYRRAEA